MGGAKSRRRKLLDSTRTLLSNCGYTHAASSAGWHEVTVSKELTLRLSKDQAYLVAVLQGASPDRWASAGSCPTCGGLFFAPAGWAINRSSFSSWRKKRRGADVSSMSTPDQGSLMHSFRQTCMTPARRNRHTRKWSDPQASTDPFSPHAAERCSIVTHPC